MGIFGTSNGTVLNAVQSQSDAQFKTVNNLLSLQDNHVEEFFQYHGELFLTTFEKLMEDVVERVVSKMLAKLQFTTDSTTGMLRIHNDAMREFEKITQEMGGMPMGQQGMGQQGMMGMQQPNNTGYPVPPAGTDNYGRPYWINPQNGQMTYEPPNSGLGIGSALQKGAAWAKWLM